MLMECGGGCGLVLVECSGVGGLVMVEGSLRRNCVVSGASLTE